MAKEEDPKSPDGNYVTMELCNERSTRILERIDTMKEELGDRLTNIENAISNSQKEKTEKSHAMRNAALTFLSGAGIALLTWVLAHI
jgi:hypothetical protein